MGFHPCEVHVVWGLTRHLLLRAAPKCSFIKKKLANTQLGQLSSLLGCQRDLH